MPFESPRIKYNGRIREAGIGQGENIIRAGGQNCYPFHSFEGTTPNLPKIAMEVYDCLPEGWPAAAIGPFKDVIGNPSQWAQKCVTEYGANMICLQLAGTDPNWLDRSPEEAARVTLEVAQAIDVPLIVWGTANQGEDSQVLTAIARECSGKRLVIGPVEEKKLQEHCRCCHAKQPPDYRFLAYRYQPGQAIKYINCQYWHSGKRYFNRSDCQQCRLWNRVLLFCDGTHSHSRTYPAGR